MIYSLSVRRTVCSRWSTAVILESIDCEIRHVNHIDSHQISHIFIFLTAYFSNLIQKYAKHMFSHKNGCCGNELSTYDDPFVCLCVCVCVRVCALCIYDVAVNIDSTTQQATLFLIHGLPDLIELVHQISKMRSITPNIPTFNENSCSFGWVGLSKMRWVNATINSNRSKRHLFELLINADEIENLSVEEKKKYRNGTEYEKFIKFAAHKKLSLAHISHTHTRSFDIES